MLTQTDFISLPGIVIIPGTSQLSAKDILYRLQASKATCIITTDKLAPAVDSVASQCQLLKTKLMVSKGSREGWLNFTELYQWVWPSGTTVTRTKQTAPTNSTTTIEVIITFSFLQKPICWPFLHQNKDSRPNGYLLYQWNYRFSKDDSTFPG